MQRVAVYIDGLNLYYALKSNRWKRFYWLNLWRLSENLLRPGQQLAQVKYFTAPFSHDKENPGQPERQDAYLQALATLPNLSIHYGYHLPKTRICKQCGAISQTHEEKMTDVNIATELLEDAHSDEFDVAILISADSDLSGPITAIKRNYPAKLIVVAFPPGRMSNKLRQISDVSFTIWRGKIAASQFPDVVINPDGYSVRKPAQWR